MRLVCFLFGHALDWPGFWVSERAEVRLCVRCRRQYAINHETGHLLAWDAELRAFYRDMHRPARPN
jgi:hypothetical protein